MAERPDRPGVRLDLWKDSDLELPRATNVPELMERLGGPETEEQLQVWHQRYLGTHAP